MRDILKCENPPDILILKFMYVLAFFLMSIGIVVGATKWGLFNGLFGFIVLMGGGISTIFASWYREYYMKPKIIETSEQGIQMVMNYSNDIILKWNEILGVFANPDEGNLLNSKLGVGFIIPKKGQRYWTTYRVALMVISEYRNHTGNDLPMMHLNEKIGAFKKRVQ
jgi:hypothetical protein